MAKGLPFFPGCHFLAEINWNNLHGWDLLNPSHIIAFSTLSLSLFLKLYGRVAAVSWGIMHCKALHRKLNQMASKTVPTWIFKNSFRTSYTWQICKHSPRRLLNQTSVHPKGKCYASGQNHLFPKPSSSRAPGVKGGDSSSVKNNSYANDLGVRVWGFFRALRACRVSGGQKNPDCGPPTSWA